MIPIFHSLRDLSFLSVFVRMILAFISGGVIGIERTYRRRAAGFRTHILICLGACVATLTSQFLVLYMKYYTDMARLGAQVIAGIGFIGAGTIIVTRQQRVKGLTTAAGLWASAIVGLSYGAGFFEGGIIATVLILVLEIFFSRIEHSIMDKTPEINMYVEYNGRPALEEVLSVCEKRNIQVLNLEITRSSATKGHNAMALLVLRCRRSKDRSGLVGELTGIDGIVSVETL